MNAPVSGNQAQISTVDHKALVHAGNLVGGKKAAKTAASSDTRGKEPVKKGKKKGKLRPGKDVGNKTARAARGSKGSPSLFSVWSGDALSLFMFNVSPLIMQLNFKLRQTLSESQKAEAQSQANAANASATLMEQKGEADCKTLHNEAYASYASAGMAAFGAAQGLGENLGTNGIMEDELAAQDRMLSDMATSKEAEEQVDLEGEGTRVDESGRSEDGESPREAHLDAERATERTEEEMNARKTKAREVARKFKRAQQEALEELKEAGPSRYQKVRDWFGRSKWFGGEKAADQVENERNLDMNRQAGSKAFEQMRSDEDFQDMMKGIRNEPETASAFMDELGDSLDETLNGLRGMPASERSEILKGFGKSEEGKAFRSELQDFRSKVTAHLASFERGMLQNGFTKRQMLGQIIDGFAGGITKNQNAENTIDAANNDAQAKIQDSIASMMASARGAQDGAIQGALSQVEGLAQWYSQMESQVIGAVTQSMA